MTWLALVSLLVGLAWSPVAGVVLFATVFALAWLHDHYYA